MCRGDVTHDATAPSVSAECVASLRLAVPTAVANLAERGAFWVTWSLVGHLGSEFLGPVSLASSVVNAFGISITIGLSIAVSTLASQAAGAESPAALGLVLQRALPVNVVFCLPVVLLLLALEPLLLACGLDADFSRHAGLYGVTMVPAAVLTGALRVLQTWLSAQSITQPQLVVACAMLPIHGVLCWALTYRTPLGYIGAGIAQSIAMALRFIALYAYIRLQPRFREIYPGFRPAEAFTGWRSYLALALPGVALLSEYWVGELLMLSAAMLPHAAATLSALAIYQLGNTTCYQPASGLRVACNARVGAPPRSNVHRTRLHPMRWHAHALLLSLSRARRARGMAAHARRWAPSSVRGFPRPRGAPRGSASCL